MLFLLLALQTAGGTSTSGVTIAPCSVIDAAPKRAVSGGAGQLVGVCNGLGATLGPADKYSSVSNVLTGGVVVVRQQAGGTQVLLVSPTQGGVAVHDITRDLTKLTGRFGDLGLGSATVDTSRFSIDGSVGVTLSGATHWLDLAPFIQAAAKIVTTALP